MKTNRQSKHIPLGGKRSWVSEEKMERLTTPKRVCGDDEDKETSV
jgi:hypothetical protein